MLTPLISLYLTGQLIKSEQKCHLTHKMLLKAPKKVVLARWLLGCQLTIEEDVFALEVVEGNVDEAGPIAGPGQSMQVSCLLFVD